VLNTRQIRTAWLLLRRNPLLLLDKIRARANSRRTLPVRPVFQEVDGVVFQLDFTLGPTMAAIYRGSYQLEVIRAMKRFIAKGSTFIDVGANIGYLSAIGLRTVGPGGEVHCFEPVPQYRKQLDRLADSNPSYRLVVNGCALGESETNAKIWVTRSDNIGWNTMVPGLMAPDEADVIETKVQRLDEYIRDRRVRNISLIKIDCEGFEFPILRGLRGFFESSDNLPPIICEVAPCAYSYLGDTLQDLEGYMNEFGYVALDIKDYSTVVDLRSLSGTTDVVFLGRRRRR
jgi:FkbM family methyltransferase